MPELQLTEDLTFQRREWVIQRLGWAAMAVLLVAGVLGFFGSGPVSDRSVSAQDGAAQVSYSRFGRFGAPGTLLIELRDAQPDTSGTVQLGLSRDYAEGVRIEQVVPEPESVKTEEDWLVYEFALDAPALLRVSIEFMFEHRGELSGEVRFPDGATLTFEQFIHP
jgi:hypothetical protein